MNKINRRKYIELTIKTGVTLPLLHPAFSACNVAGGKGKAAGINKKLNILILGGTSFLGPHQIAYAMNRGHSITTFTRGKTKPTIHRDLFGDVEMLIGDRKDNLTALKNRKWDAVIDNSGHNAEWTKASAELLKENVELYLYTSSTGVYYPYLKDNLKEEDPVLLVEPENIEDEEMKLEYWYGVMKANSEIQATDQFGKNRTIIVRPTYMIGPADKSNRFIHWPVRLSQGGEVLVPGKKEDPVQYIDVRDAAGWMIRLLEKKNIGTYNAVGPKSSQDMYSFVDEAASAFDVETTFIKIDDYDFLKKQGIHHIVPWIMPEENNYGSARINNQKAVQNGLLFRPLVDSVKDTYDWWYSDALTAEQRKVYENNPKTVLAREREIINAWFGR